MQVDALDVLVAETAARLEREGRYARTRHFVQHGGVTVYDHCLRVAAMSCRLARALDLDVDTDALVRGALLHDYFLYDWHEKDDSHRLHGFTHPRRALENACGREIVRVDESAYRDVVSDENGTSFTLLADGKEAGIRTVLLGRHTAKNIALAAALALRLGVTCEQIADACRKLEYVPHRLQVLRRDGVTVIDDSYNANPVGAADAVETLRGFSGKKIIVTPGLVELGILEKESNEAFGASLAGLDEVVLVGDTLVGAVKRGYLAAGGDEAKVHIFPTLRQAQDALPSLICESAVVLFLNDLPDIYA